LPKGRVAQTCIAVVSFSSGEAVRALRPLSKTYIPYISLKSANEKDPSMPNADSDSASTLLPMLIAGLVMIVVGMIAVTMFV
jgi:hypothetical protein